MSRLTASLYPIDGGNPFVLKRMVNVHLEKRLDSPAESLQLTALCPQAPPAVGEVKFYYQEELVFSGYCDWQRWEQGAQGCLLSIEARSLGAVLLDDQARPETVWGANLSTAFSRWIGSAGGVLVSDKGACSVPEFTVGQGQSRWQAFSSFSQQAVGRAPLITEGQIRFTLPDTPALCWGESGKPFTKCQQEFSTYPLLSCVHLQNEDGEFYQRVKNPVAPRYQMTRQRYAL